jgi:hypothetical protein
MKASPDSSLTHSQTALTATTEDQHYLFDRFFLYEDTVREIGAATHRTCNAVWQARRNMRHCIRTLLEQQGLDAEESHDYLLIIIMLSASRFLPPKRSE